MSVRMFSSFLERIKLRGRPAGPSSGLARAQLWYLRLPAWVAEGDRWKGPLANFGCLSRTVFWLAFLGIFLATGPGALAQSQPNARVPTWLQELGEVVLGSPQEQARRNPAPNRSQPPSRRNSPSSSAEANLGQIFPHPGTAPTRVPQSASGRGGVHSGPGHARSPQPQPGQSLLGRLLGLPPAAPREQAGATTTPSPQATGSAPPPDPSWLDSMFGLPTQTEPAVIPGRGPRHGLGVRDSDDSGGKDSQEGLPPADGGVASGVQIGQGSRPLPGGSSLRQAEQSPLSDPSLSDPAGEIRSQTNRQLEPGEKDLPSELPVHGSAQRDSYAPRSSSEVRRSGPSVPARGQPGQGKEGPREPASSQAGDSSGDRAGFSLGRSEQTQPAVSSMPTSRDGDLGIHRRLQELMASPFARSTNVPKPEEGHSGGGPQSSTAPSRGSKGEALAGDLPTAVPEQSLPAPSREPSPTLAEQPSAAVGQGSSMTSRNEGAASGGPPTSPTPVAVPKESRSSNSPQSVVSGPGPLEQAPLGGEASGKAGVAWTSDGEIGPITGSIVSGGKTTISQTMTPAGPKPEGASPIGPSEAPSAQNQHAVEQMSPGSLVPSPEQQPASMESRPSLGANDPRTGSRVLLIRQGPIIQVETTGSEKLLKGQAATYEIRVRNAGESDAEEFVLRVGLPAWVELVASKPSRGEIRTTRQGSEGGKGGNFARELEWHLPVLAPQQQEVLELQLLPQRSEVLDLALSWDHKPARSRASIRVEEPQLRLRVLSGRDLLARVRQPVEVQVENAGTARAEEVHVRFSIDGAGELSPPSVLVEGVEVGERKLVLVELTAQRPGPIALSCQATSRGGFQTQITERLIIREPRLALRWHLPSSTYLGAELQGELVVSNQGDAPAEEAVVKIHWPAAAEWLQAPPEMEPLLNSGTVDWKVGRISPGEEKSLSFRLRPRELGTLVWSAEVISGPWNAAASTSVQVQGFASLHLSLIDPPQPVPVGTEVPYEVRIENRGTKTVESFEVAVFFSWGIEPVAAEGAPAILAPGQVIFGRVGPLGPGQEKRLRVIALAENAGNHACRAELGVPDWPTKLVAQQVTPYYVPHVGTADSPGNLARGKKTTSTLPVRVADRSGGERPNSAGNQASESPSDKPEASGQTPLPQATGGSAPIRR